MKNIFGCLNFLSDQNKNLIDLVASNKFSTKTELLFLSHYSLFQNYLQEL